MRYLVKAKVKPGRGKPLLAAIESGSLGRGSVAGDEYLEDMAKARIGHFVEAQILQALGVDFVDESEVLPPADEAHHIDKLAFKVPFVCGARDLGEALRRIGEGAAASLALRGHPAWDKKAGFRSRRVIGAWPPTSTST